jgi:hypothetical protein
MVAATTRGRAGGGEDEGQGSRRGDDGSEQGSAGGEVSSADPEGARFHVESDDREWDLFTFLPWSDGVKPENVALLRASEDVVGPDPGVSPPGCPQMTTVGA